MTRIDRLAALLTATLMLANVGTAAWGVRLVHDVLAQMKSPLEIVAAGTRR